MNHKAQTPPPRQTPLPLGNGAQWEQLPPDVRDRCRQLVAQLLRDLARPQATGGDDER